MKRSQTIPIIIILFLFVAIPVRSDTSDLEFNILDLGSSIFHSSFDFGTIIELRFVIQVDNPTFNTITILHPNTCGIAVRISYIGDLKWEDKSRFDACGDAFTTTDFDPGLKEISKSGAISFFGDTSGPGLVTLPDGQYTVTLYESTSVKTKIVVLDFYVNDGDLFVGNNTKSSLIPSSSFINIIGTLFCILKHRQIRKR